MVQFTKFTFDELTDLREPSWPRHSCSEMVHKTALALLRAQISYSSFMFEEKKNVLKTSRISLTLQHTCSFKFSSLMKCYLTTCFFISSAFLASTVGGLVISNINYWLSLCRCRPLVVRVENFLPQDTPLPRMRKPQKQQINNLPLYTEFPSIVQAKFYFSNSPNCKLVFTLLSFGHSYNSSPWLQAVFLQLE